MRRTMMSSTLMGGTLALAMGAAGVALAGGEPATGTTPHPSPEQGTSKAGHGVQRGVLPSDAMNQTEPGTRAAAPAPTDSDTATGSDATTANPATTGSRATIQNGSLNVPLQALSDMKARELQQRLQRLGFYQGPIDGKIEQGTRAALQRYFQRQAELAQQGVLSHSTMMGLFGGPTSEMQPVSGQDVDPQGSSIEREPSLRQQPTQPQQGTVREPANAREPAGSSQQQPEAHEEPQEPTHGDAHDEAAPPAPMND